jgi:hypothetical protein
MRAIRGAITDQADQLAANVRERARLSRARFCFNTLAGLLSIFALLLVASCDWTNATALPTAVSSPAPPQATNSVGISNPPPVQATSSVSVSNPIPVQATSAVATNAPACGPDWSIVASPNTDGNIQELRGVAAVSDDDVWAVGYYQKDSIFRTLVEHWNGTEWSIVPSPNPESSKTNVLYSVAAASSNNVWAVGQYLKDDDYQTLVEHWDGSAWSIVSSPSPGSDNILSALAITSSNNLWAVGDYASSKTDDQTLIVQIDASNQSVVSNPNQGPVENSFAGVAAISPNDVWAVGHYVPDNPNVLTLIEHWDGTAWSIVPSPNPSAKAQNVFNAVAAVSSNDVWAAGFYFNGTIYQPLVEHWNGSTWSVVATPGRKTGYNFLYGIAAASSNDVWAAGYYGIGSGNQTLIEHWNGTEWSIVPSPNQNPGDNKLQEIAVTPAGEVWAVGSYNNSQGTKTLIERYKLCTASPSSAPTP